MSIYDGKLNIAAACAGGTEAVVKRELTALGYSPSGAEQGRIPFEGEMRDVMRANIFLRAASRVYIVLGSFTAETFDELFEGTRSVEWPQILPPDARLTIEAKSVKSRLYALPSIQSVVKKAVVSSMNPRGGRMSEDGEEYVVEASVFEDRVTLSLDTSGDGLHKRGYRAYLGAAPMRETLAAAIIMLSVWRPDRPFIDPFCGSGTLPVEAALIGLNVAPGMRRSFACDSFTLAPRVREEVQKEAEDLIVRDAALRISGFDIDPSAVALAQKHADRAGVRDKIHLQARDVRELSSRFSHGVIVANPPYGERLLNEAALKDLYRDFGKAFASLDEWCAYVITSFNGFEKYFGRRADKTRRLYNSELNCTLFQFLGAPPKPRGGAE